MDGRRSAHTSSCRSMPVSFATSLHLLIKHHLNRGMLEFRNRIWFLRPLRISLLSSSQELLRRRERGISSWEMEAKCILEDSMRVAKLCLSRFYDQSIFITSIFTTIDPKQFPLIYESISHSPNLPAQLTASSLSTYHHRL